MIPQFATLWGADATMEVDKELFDRGSRTGKNGSKACDPAKPAIHFGGSDS